MQEKGNFRKRSGNCQGVGRPSKIIWIKTLPRWEVNDEIGIVIKYPENEVFRIPKTRHDFIVLKAEYYSGELLAKNEIERVESFIPDEIRQMIEENKILPDHAKALSVYLYGA